MNIQHQKKLSSKILFFLLIFSVISCKGQDTEMKVISILSGIEVVNSDYVYSEESVFKLKDKAYSLRAKADYENGELIKIIVYKSEGIIEYNKDDILKDSAIASNYGFPTKQNWKFTNSKGLIKDYEVIKAKLSDDFIIEIKEGSSVIIYQLK